MPARAGEPPHGNDDADEPAVKRHAPLPDLHNHGRVANETRKVVEQHVAEAPADNGPERNIEKQVVDGRAGPGTARIFGSDATQTPGDGKAEEIHETVPVNLHGPERKDDRVDIGIGDHGPEF